MTIFNKDIIDLSRKNEFWQKEVFRDGKVQIVMMNIPAGEEIGLESHSADQTTFLCRAMRKWWWTVNPQRRVPVTWW